MCHPRVRPPDVVAQRGHPPPLWGPGGEREALGGEALEGEALTQQKLNSQINSQSHTAQSNLTLGTLT